MSRVGGDLSEHNSQIDFDPQVGEHRPSHGGSWPESQLINTEEPSSSRPHQEESGSDQEREWKDDLCHAICVNKWSDAKAILDQNPNSLTSVISDYGRTPLHVAAMLGHMTIVEELLKLMPPEFLLTCDYNGDAALVLASRFSGVTQVAKCLVEKNESMPGIPNKLDNIPVIVAFASGYQEMGRYLYSVTPLEYLRGRRGSSLLCVYFHAQCFDIALNLLQQCEELLFEPINDEGKMPIHEIATLNTAMLSPSELVFWKRWIYNYVNIPSTTAINHVSVDIQQDRVQGNRARLTEPGHGLLLRLITSTDNFAGVKKLRELKLLHAQADELLGLVCKNARKAYQKRVIMQALCLAAKEGNVKFVLQVSKEIPEIFLSGTSVSCFNLALDYRQAGVFNLIHGLRFKLALVISKDEDGDALIHKAAKMAPDHVLNRIYAPTLQMQRELQWFKEIESLTPPSIRGIRNKHDMTAEESFRENHKELMKEGEEWIKNTASSCSVVGTLIVTIMFAVAFTVPGGNEQNHGYPLFIQQPYFKVFIFSTIISFLSSSTSVLMFLAILTSKYSEEKFLKSLPNKLILGLFCLFFSIASMIIAFLSSIHLMLKHSNSGYSWGTLPIIILAIVPISQFVLSEFPLLLHTCVSTYGNIFDRKVEAWP